MVKIIGIVGSPKKDGNTSYLVETALKSAKSAGADTDIINLGSVNIEPCVACDICKAMGECGIEDDIKEILEIMMESDGMIIGSPYTLEVLHPN